ncbi:hypothetical protein GCM10008012_26020 [Rhizobium anhuiense]|nr:hypothetical protein GCM10008012_26020 [Rhizobium anhuiense]
MVDFDPRKRRKRKMARNALSPSALQQRLRPWLLFVPLAAVVLGGAYGWATVAPNDTISTSFSICGAAARNTCVVDGDTFWLQGVKWHIAVRRFRAACRRQQAHEAMRHGFNVLGSLSSTRLVRQGSSGISAGI